ncbi:MAG: hypothetical protein WCP79_09990 [Bacillota bacterium]
MNKFEKCGRFIGAIDGLHVSHIATAVYVFILGHAAASGLVRLDDAKTADYLALTAAEYSTACAELRALGFMTWADVDGMTEYQLEMAAGK